MLVFEKTRMTLPELKSKLEELTLLETTCKDPFGIVKKTRLLNIQLLSEEIKLREETNNGNRKISARQNHSVSC